MSDSDVRGLMKLYKERDLAIREYLKAIDAPKCNDNRYGDAETCPACKARHDAIVAALATLRQLVTHELASMVTAAQGNAQAAQELTASVARQALQAAKRPHTDHCLAWNTGKSPWACVCGIDDHNDRIDAALAAIAR